MPRNVEQILKDDEEKAELGVNDTENTEQTGGAAAGTPPEGPSPEEVAADLRKQLEEANARAERAETARKEAEAHRVDATAKQRTAMQSEISTRESAIASKKSAAATKLDSIKNQLKQAVLADDKEAMVELQDEMTNARYELNAATWEETNFKTWKDQNAQQQTQQQQQTQKTTSQYTQKEQKWLDDHPEFKTNKQFARLVKVSATEALEQGYEHDSKGYFDYIERQLRDEGFLDETGRTITREKNDDASAASTAAAPSRSGNGTGVTVPSKNSKYPYLPKNFTIPKQWIDDAPLLGFDGPEGYLEYANDRLREEAESKGRA